MGRRRGGHKIRELRKDGRVSSPVSDGILIASSLGANDLYATAP